MVFVDEGSTRTIDDDNVADDDEDQADARNGGMMMQGAPAQQAPQMAPQQNGMQGGSYMMDGGRASCLKFASYTILRNESFHFP